MNIFCDPYLELLNLQASVCMFLQRNYKSLARLTEMISKYQNQTLLDLFEIEEKERKKTMNEITLSSIHKKTDITTAEYKLFEGGKHRYTWFFRCAILQKARKQIMTSPSLCKYKTSHNIKFQKYVIYAKCDFLKLSFNPLSYHRSSLKQTPKSLANGYLT